MITPTATVRMGMKTMTIPPTTTRGKETTVITGVNTMVKVTSMETALVMKPLNQNSVRSSDSPSMYIRGNMTWKLI
jgi:hypothetical protein